jgi:hypothetical protein
MAFRQQAINHVAAHEAAAAGEEDAHLNPRGINYLFNLSHSYGTIMWYMGKNNKEHNLLRWVDREALVSLLSGVLGVVASLVGALVAVLGGSIGTKQHTHFDIWIPVALGAVVALLLIVFTFLLKREPSKVIHLRQKITSTYLNLLTESVKGTVWEANHNG